jgi:hypothetical protein
MQIVIILWISRGFCPKLAIVRNSVDKKGNNIEFRR